MGPIIPPGAQLQAQPGAGCSRFEILNWTEVVLFYMTISFSTGGFILVSDYCVWRLHWSVRRGSWSRVIKTGVDFIPMKFCGVPSCLALGVGALSGRGAGGWVPYCLRVTPRVQAAHCPADLLYADTRRFLLEQN